MQVNQVKVFFEANLISYTISITFKAHIGYKKIARV